MQKGELETEPEMHLDHDRKGGEKNGCDGSVAGQAHWDGRSEGVEVRTKTGKGGVDVDADTFFGNDEYEDGMIED
jgi:hypothetical protein